MLSCVCLLRFAMVTCEIKWNKIIFKNYFSLCRRPSEIILSEIENTKNHKRWYYFAAQWHFGNVLRYNTIFCDFCCERYWQIAVKLTVDSGCVAWPTKSRPPQRESRNWAKNCWLIREYILGLHWISFFQIRPGSDLAGFGIADPAGAGTGAECSWAGVLGYIT